MSALIARLSVIAMLVALSVGHRATAQFMLPNYAGQTQTIQNWMPNAGISVVGTTATVTIGGAGYITLGSASRSSGKFYFEVVPTGTGFTGTQSGIGVGNTGSPTITALIGGIGGSESSTLGYYTNGSIYNHGSRVDDFGDDAAYSSGDNVGFALDLDDGLVWVRINGGAWVSGNGTPCDPTIGLRGLALPSGTIALPVLPAAGLYNTTTPDSVVGKFSAISWTYSAPAGYGPF